MKLKLLFFILFPTILLSQKIVHNPITNLQLGESLQIEASIIGFNPNEQENPSVLLFYRSIGQESYNIEKMKYVNGIYIYTIPDSFISSGVEYFIFLEANAGGFYTFPYRNAKENPILVKSKKLNEQIFNLNQSEDGKLFPEYQILSPENNSRLFFEDLLISLSHFKMEDLDPTYTKIMINGDDYTSLASIKGTHFTLIPTNKFDTGDYQIKVLFRSLSGLEYEPIIWNFKIIDQKLIESQNMIISKGGDLSGNFNSSVNDGENLDIGVIDGNYHIDLDWMKFKTDFLLSSLEDNNEQPKNRISFNFKTDYFNIKLGDSYPSYSEYTINGARLRGVNILYNNNFVKIHFLSGSLVRSAQGLGHDGGMLLLENQVPKFSENEGLDDSDESMGIIDVSRDNYTFNQGLLGLKLDLKTSKKFKWSLELLKIKDKIESVDYEINGAIFSLPEDMTKHLFSDIYVDYDGSGTYTESIGEPEFLGLYNEESHDVVGDYVWTDISNIALDTNLISSVIYSTVNLGTYNKEPFVDVNNNDEYDGSCDDGSGQIDGGILTEEDCNAAGPEYEWTPELFIDIDSDGEWSNDVSYNLLQNQVFIDVEYEDLDAIINYFKVYEGQIYGENGEYPWSVCTNNDCFGDYEVNFLSDQWEGDKPQDNIVLTSDFLHTLDDGLLKIKYGFGFSMLNQNIWNPALSYQTLDEFGAENEAQENDGLFNNEFEIPENIDDIQNFEDIFQTGISQVPIIPIDISDGKISFKDFLSLPSAALYFDVNHKYFDHNISWGIKQIGPEFYSLGNPYIQTNIREQYFSDRTYLLDNKLNLSFKWKRTEDGISISEDNGQSDKYDINLGFYPGIGMPTYNVSMGIYTRENGIDPLYEPITYVMAENDINNNAVADSIPCANLGLYPNFDITCDDDQDYYYEEYEILETQLYQPEQTQTGQFSLSINGSFDYIYKHNYSINIFYSNKRDLINISKYMILNNDYYSPRSLTQSYNLSARTKVSNRLETSLIASYSYYNYGNEEEYQTYHPEYFQYQSIYSLDLSGIYDTRLWMGKINPAMNVSVGRGSSRFTQITFRSGSKIPIIENFSLNFNLNYKFKIIEKHNYDHNYSLYMDLKYKF